MPGSMHTVSIPIFIQHLNSLNTVLDKAAAWAAARKVNAADPVARYVQSGATGAGRDRSRRQRGRASRRRHARSTRLPGRPDRPLSVRRT